MSTFAITPVEKGIMRCSHSGEITPSDVQSLTKFFEDYSGKLLVDLSGSDPEACSRHIRNLRPMMPTAAIFGVNFGDQIVDAPESYYTHPVKVCKTEAEALEWLRNQ